MRVDPHGALHLTYCTNIHAADGWPAVDRNLRRYAPALKRRLAPAEPFGVGLRLAAVEARDLLAGGAVAELAAFLEAEGLYVAIINGFPFGAFHRTAVKADVYAPDWRDRARVDYTVDLIDIISRIAPPDVDAGVSTVPLSYKAWMATNDRDGWTRMATHVAEIAARLTEIRLQTGRRIHLDIEPEPDCLLETSRETVAFFEQWLLPIGVPVLERLGLSKDEARSSLFEHVQVCFDCCHFAVEYEDPVEALARLRGADIRIGRIQLSSAIRVEVPSERAARHALNERLRPFADSTYLHQVVTRRAEALDHFPDLDDALRCAEGCGDEWRIHFHVPLFAERFDGLDSTQDYVARVLALARDEPITSHLEIETYTWDVLPGALKLDLADSIGREYAWVLDTLGAGRP